jgi:predicted Zn-ribbon and HTH transcriptional regulator
MITMEEKFKTVVTGGGYNHKHIAREQNSKTFHGVECPRCKHQFVPQPITKPAKCPACGFEEKA